MSSDKTCPPRPPSRGASHLFPWNHDKRNLYNESARIQKAAGIELTCPDEGKKGHTCTDSCHLYGFPYTHARYNYRNPNLQNQMGHACAATTEHYRKWAKRQLAEYNAYVPKLEEAQVADERAKPRLRVVG